MLRFDRGMDDLDASTFPSGVAVIENVVQQQSLHQSNTQIQVRFALEYRSKQC